MQGFSYKIIFTAKGLLIYLDYTYLIDKIIQFI